MRCRWSVFVLGIAVLAAGYPLLKSWYGGARCVLAYSCKGPVMTNDQGRVVQPPAGMGCCQPGAMVVGPMIKDLLADSSREDLTARFKATAAGARYSEVDVRRALEGVSYTISPTLHDGQELIMRRASGKRMRAWAGTRF